MRGKVSAARSKAEPVGITPAHAGKSSLPFLHEGSPPHMRGKDLSRLHVRGLSGITPAHAGKRLSSIERKTPSGDHPRTCGEKTQEVTKYKAYDILHA